MIALSPGYPHHLLLINGQNIDIVHCTYNYVCGIEGEIFPRYETIYKVAGILYYFLRNIYKYVIIFLLMDSKYLQPSYVCSIQYEK